MKNLKTRRIYLILAFLLTTVIAMADSDVSVERRQQNTPSGWTAVQLPNIAAITNANTFNITSYGAGTGSSDNASAINAAITAANAAGGGMVVIPSGTWLSGPITMKSNVVLHMSKNCTLKVLPFKGFNQNVSAGEPYYPVTGWTSTTKDGKTTYSSTLVNFISNGGQTVNDIIIEGEGETSVIEGQGEPWWELRDEIGDYTRPNLIRIEKGARHLFRNFKTHNSMSQNIVLGRSGNANNITVHGITIDNPSSEASTPSHNTDGFPIWGPYVNIYDCNISTGDDNIVCDSKAHHIHAWNITCGDGHGMSIGSYTSELHDVIYEGITFTGTGSGFRIKTNADRSGNDQTGTNGAVKNIICRNATMTGCPSPIKITSWYDKDVETPSNNPTSDVSATTPEFCDILFQNITANAVSGKTSWKHNRPIYLYGRPEMYIHDVTFDNVKINSVLGMFMAFAKNVTFKNGCKIVNTNGSAITTEYLAYSDNGSTLLSANASKYNGSESATTYPVTFKNGSETYKTYNICPNSYAYPPTDPTKSNATFLGWATSEGGDPVTLAQTQLAAGGTFYAVWENGEQGGEEVIETIYSLQVNSGQTLGLDSNGSSQLSTEATITGGTATVHNGKSSRVENMVSSGAVNLGGSSGSYLKITLSNNTFKAGDVITVTNAGNYKISNTNSGATQVTFPYTVTSSDAINGKADLYIWKTGTSGDPSSIKTVTVTRTTSGGDPSGSTVNGTETTPVQKASNIDAVGLCYTIPATYVGGQGNSSKAIKFNLLNDKIEINVNPNYTITGFTFTGNDNYATTGIRVSSVNIDGSATNVLSETTDFPKDKSESSFSVSNINATQNITINTTYITAPGTDQSADTQLNGTIVFTYKYDVQPLALQSSTKTSSRNGSVTLNFNNPMAATTAKATVNGKQFVGDADGTSVTFVYSGLDYGQSYTFTLPAGSLKDEFNQTYNEAVNLTITTDARPTTTKKAFDRIVSNVTELAAAITAANIHGSERYRIFVKNGTYKLTGSGEDKTVSVELQDGSKENKTYPNPTTVLSGSNVSIIGESYDKVIITNNAGDFDTYVGKYGTANIAEGIGNGDVLQINKNATGSYFQGITIKTSMGDARGRDIAVNDQGNKTIMKDVCLWGYQDTYVSNNSNGRFYFDGGVLRGRTDYLCGKGDVYYDKVTLQQVGTGGYLAVPSMPTKYGYVFNECYIKKETNDVTYYLGRPWGQGTPAAYFINTKVDAAPITAGWDEMIDGWPYRFAEYNTRTTSNAVVSTSGRKTTFASTHPNNPVLTADEAEFYGNMARIMGGTDGWDPTEYTEQCAAPTATLSGATLSWSDDQYASSWVVFKDGVYYANPTTNSLALTEYGTYTVRAANSMGGLGEASVAVEYVDDHSGTVNATVKMTWVDKSNPTVSKGEVTTAQAGYNKISNNSVVFENESWNCNWITYIQVDASKVPANRRITSATLTAKVSGSTDNKRNTEWGVGYNNSEWSSAMTYDTANRSIVTLGATQWTSYPKNYATYSSSFEEKQFDITNAFTNDDDNIVTILVYEKQAAGGYIKDVSVSVDYDTPVFDVTFHNGDAQYGETQHVEMGNTVDKPTDPEKTGYTFNGWSLTNGGTTAETFPYTVTAATDFYAIWEEVIEPTYHDFSMTTPTTAPSKIGDMVVEGGSLSDESTNDKSLGFDKNGVKFGSGYCKLKITLTDNIVAGATISVTYKNTSTTNTTGLGVFDSNSAKAVINLANNIASSASGTHSYTFKSTDASYIGKNELIITRNGGSGGLAISEITVTFPTSDAPTTYAISEDISYSSFAEGTYETVTLKRTFPCGEWTTLVLPFDVYTAQLIETFPDPANSEVAVVTKLQNDKLYFKTQDHINANEPVLIYLSQVNNDNVYTFRNVTVENAAEAKYEGATDVTMTGTYQTIDGHSLTANDYFIGGGKFYDCTYLSIMKPFRGYFSAPVAGGKLSLFIGDESDDATAVEAVEAVQMVNDDEPVYNLAGQRMKAGMAKGLMIRGHRKFVVR